ncbi:hypothetical protein ZIOFF_021416 [Zingiber officinale]|uniref:Uncharacterized protein n=1 Tax=Zingiber officinale TaxID=94328 RepID=A0A8J5LH05_ZINOF|nr:hypothetical protein ZIOFF_021416 [Zingiber officinale]
MITNSRLVSQNIRSCHLRAFALPSLRACAAQFFLGCLRKWSPESFRLARLESLCCSILPWMSEEGNYILS